MKRTIKFRQYLGKGKWHYLEFKHGHCEGVAEASLDKYPISQFTGLLDKNSKEIYEGDIVDTVLGVRAVKWAEDIAGFECVTELGSRSLYGFMKDKKGINVIGNIFEHPELLEGESK